MMGVPLITLGMPVRNGAATLRSALDSMVNQDYPNLEIVISDNASADPTPDILRDYAARYSFIRIFRHDVPLTAVGNFTFVLEQARGAFFGWCAHDDTRSLNFVSGLLPAFADPQTVLAFGDLYILNGRDSASLRKVYDFANDGLPRWRRLRKAALMQCFHIYGLWRVDALRSLRIRYASWWPDLPIMMGMAANGIFRYVPGVTFEYFEVIKTTDERSYHQDHRAPAYLIVNLLDVFRGCCVTVTRAVGVFYGTLALFFLVEKFSRQVLQRCARHVAIRANFISKES
jgi:glycosyltransferase involved in cell wall biosynthesis